MYPRKAREILGIKEQSLEEKFAKEYVDILRSNTIIDGSRLLARIAKTHFEEHPEELTQ